MLLEIQSYLIDMLLSKTSESTVGNIPKQKHEDSFIQQCMEIRDKNEVL